MAKMNFEEAKRMYVHRFTMEHVPAWARKVRVDGTYYAPQYRSDREWFERTLFGKEAREYGAPRGSCMSLNQTWPLGKALPEPYKK